MRFLLALLYAALIGSQTAPTPGNGDPLYYLHASRTLRAGLGLRNLADAPPATERLIGPNGGLYTTWPPLYPMLLSVFDDALTGAKVINVVSFVLALVCGWLLLCRYVQSLFLRTGALVAFAVSPAALFIYREPQTDGIFTAFTLLMLVLMERIDKPRALVLLALTLAILCGLRYAGFIYVPFVIAAQRWQGWRTAVDTLALGSLAGMFAAWWFARNWYVTGHFTGHNLPGYGLDMAVQSYGHTVSGWLAEMVIVMVLVGVAYVAVGGIRRLVQPVYHGIGRGDDDQ